MINRLLREKGITKYRLSKESGVPQTTIIDICSGKTRIEKCSAETIYRIAKTIGVSMESLLEPTIESKIHVDYRVSFEVFKSNVCHYVKDKGDIEFMIEVLERENVRKLYNKKWYPEAFYLLAMLDYLSRENNVPICTNYNDIRACKLEKPLYPTSLLLASKAMNTEKYKEESLKNAIPEFMHFNIVESEVRNVY